jgi:small subunit ribosomal protein S10e
MKMMNSLKSRGLVKEQFNWQHFYWFLNNEGIEYIRGYCHIPQTVVPNTLKKPKAPVTKQPAPGAPRSESRRTFGDEKKVGASEDFKPRFVSICSV